MGRKTRVLVLCTGNSARSRMLEAILGQRLAEHVEAASAGTSPASEVHPLAVRALEEIGIRHHGGRPGTVAEVGWDGADIVVTVCDRARESCPVLPGAPVLVHVGYPDPAAAEGTEEERLDAFRVVRDSMASWVELTRALLER